jgi:hypothetical protein
LPVVQWNRAGLAAWAARSLKNCTAGKDQTALGLVVRMMSAGIVVKLLLWMPAGIQSKMVSNLADEHRAVAAAVQDHNSNLQALWQLSQPIE